MEGEKRVRLPDQDPQPIRRMLDTQPVIEYVLSLDQLTAERDIQTHPLGTVVEGLERHTNRQTGFSRISWAVKK